MVTSDLKSKLAVPMFHGAEAVAEEFAAVWKPGCSPEFCQRSALTVEELMVQVFELEDAELAAKYSLKEGPDARATLWLEKNIALQKMNAQKSQSILAAKFLFVLLALSKLLQPEP